ncbi:2OG-Fe dioxygenase family protein [Streptomyces inhibens]|uniref:2OG-Fe dioxygenase family protein n=1 Tax=Streptomyces inhibens TaxID=2293571 RepID=UPI001EE6A152|nr:2OG-Fe dioxygenase family protein [Streptomyces inhibens]UKY54815.1 2OG-Fe dioxygenase family protein [Streptomyces inhibens]
MAIRRDPFSPCTAIPTPPSAAVGELCRKLDRDNACILPGEWAQSLLLSRNPRSLSDWDAFQQSWSRMPLDGFMNDGGRYRRRRFSTLRACASSYTFYVNPPQAHYQHLQHNWLNGGFPRFFAPVRDEILYSRTMNSLLELGAEVFGQLSPDDDWHVEVHQFRITAQGTASASPTPEGRHRDGVRFVMMVLVRRENVSGGTTILYDLDDQRQAEVALGHPLDLVLVNDERVRHEVTPLIQANSRLPGLRDVLVVTFSSGWRSAPTGARPPGCGPRCTGRSSGPAGRR